VFRLFFFLNIFQKFSIIFKYK